MNKLQKLVKTIYFTIIVVRFYFSPVFIWLCKYRPVTVELFVQLITVLGIKLTGSWLSWQLHARTVVQKAGVEEGLGR